MKSAAFVATAFAIAIVALYSMLITRAVTPSLPLGLYIRTLGNVHRGSIVLFGMPKTLRPYFETVGGIRFFDNPRNGFLKPIAAVEGDHVCSDGETLAINGRLVAIADRTIPHGEKLPTWIFCGQLGRGEILPISTHSKNSIDGRYYGAIRVEDAAPFAPLYTWE